MATPFFQFKQFTVWHDHCAMKVGTDGVLLGAYAKGGKRILDVGTGTGLLALMMAQRCPDSQVWAVEMVEEAAEQARQNAARSPFAERVQVIHHTFQEWCVNPQWHAFFDAVVCNPPYFLDALKNPDKTRSVARHADTLTYSQLFKGVSMMTAPHAVMSVVIPVECKAELEAEASIYGFFLSDECSVKTVQHKPVRRVLMQFTKTPPAGFGSRVELLQNADGSRSEWYRNLTKDFYIYP